MDYEKELIALRNEFEEYKKSGFWTRRDFLRGAFAVGGGLSLAHIAAAGNMTADFNASNPNLFINNIALVKTTAGQTINVGTAAELTAALSLLASAPSLLGNVTLQVTANITGNFTIPALIYNGFELIVQGSLTEVLSDTATGGANTVVGVSKGYYEKTTAAYTTNAYRNMLMFNPSNHCVAIDSNTATRILYSADANNFTVFSNGETVSVKDFTYTITSSSASQHTFVISEYAKVTFRNIKVTHTGSLAAVYAFPFSKIKSRTSFFDSNYAFGTIYMQTAFLDSYASVYSGKNLCLWVDLNSSYFSTDLNFLEKLGGDIFFLKTAPAGFKTGIIIGQSVGQQRHACFNSVDSQPASSKAIWIIDAGSELMLYSFIDSFQSGIVAQFGGSGRNISFVYTNVGTNLTPAAATDPAWLG